MTDEPIAKIADFHQELLSMQRLGLPLELGFPPSRVSLESRLDQIQRRIALQVDRQIDVMQAIAGDLDLPKPYRSAVATWIGCDQPTEVLEGLTSAASARRELHGQLSIAMVAPLLILALVYAGMIYLCLHVAPQLESMYTQMWQPVGGSLEFLQRLRAAMPIWVPGIPIIAAVSIRWWLLRRGRMRFGWLFGGRSHFTAIQTAAYARHLATLLEAGYSMGKALARVGPLPTGERGRDDDLATANVYLSTAEDIGQQVQADDPAIAALPPLLRWALLGSDDGQHRSGVLRQVAEIYTDTANRQARRWRVLLPMLLSGGIGGVLVLFYGLALFMPYVEMLKHLAAQLGR